MASLLIKNGTLITWGTENQVLADQALLIEDGVIQAIGPTSELVAQYPTTPSLDAKGQYVMPGGICSHTHFYGAYARGMAIPGDPPADFPAVLKQLWWPLDKALDAESVKIGW